MVAVPKLAPETVISTLKLLSTPSSNNNLAIFIMVQGGLKADSSTTEKFGLTKEKYCIRLTAY